MLSWTPEQAIVNFRRADQIFAAHTIHRGASVRLGPLECVTTGMAFLYLCVNATFVLELIPIKGRDQTWKQAMKEWHAFTEVMAYRFMDGLSPALLVAAIFQIEGGILVGNYFYRVMSDGLLINLLIVLPGVLYFGNRVAPPAKAAAKET
jgi:hypothetical protein